MTLTDYNLTLSDYDMTLTDYDMTRLYQTGQFSCEIDSFLTTLTLQRLFQLDYFSLGPRTNSKPLHVRF